MSQHPSLRYDSVGVKHRNVLKRFERIKKLQASGKVKEGSSIYNLPKVKSLKIKVKKVKEAPAAEGAEGAAAATPAIKPAATKPAAGKKA